MKRYSSLKVIEMLKVTKKLTEESNRLGYSTTSRANFSTREKIADDILKKYILAYENTIPQELRDGLVDLVELKDRCNKAIKSSKNLEQEDF